MKRSLAAVVALLTVTVGACDPNGKAPEASRSEAPGAAVNRQAPQADKVASSPPAATSTEGAAMADAIKVGGAPDFAAVYPGGTIEAPPTLAGGPAGPGGLVTFTTDAKPDAVIGFYKQRAEAAGLASVMSMNQGDSLAYGAAEVTNGATLQVVATALEDAPTSVQVTWSAGQ
ncbi:MAG TPA: hypothetical protein VF633_07945 [Brevundimonas sp.]|jgi:hypothetical protein